MVGGEGHGNQRRPGYCWRWSQPARPSLCRRIWWSLAKWGWPEIRPVPSGQERISEAASAFAAIVPAANEKVPEGMQIFGVKSFQTR